MEMGGWSAVACVSVSGTLDLALPVLRVETDTMAGAAHSVPLCQGRLDPDPDIHAPIPTPQLRPAVHLRVPTASGS